MLIAAGVVLFCIYVGIGAALLVFLALTSNPATRGRMRAPVEVPPGLDGRCAVNGGFQPLATRRSQAKARLLARRSIDRKGVN